MPHLDRFADLYRLVYYDQRGRGKSADGVQPDGVALATDLEDIERVRQHFGLEAPTLLGHSSGTVLALEYALRYPNRVSRLVLMNPAPASSADAVLLRKAYTTQLGDQMERQRAIVTGQAYRQADRDTVAERYRIHFTHALAKPEHYEALMRRCGQPSSRRPHRHTQGTGRRRSPHGGYLGATLVRPVATAGLLAHSNARPLGRSQSHPARDLGSSQRVPPTGAAGDARRLRTFRVFGVPPDVRTALQDFARRPPAARRQQ